LALFNYGSFVLMMMGPATGIMAGYATSTMYHFVAERRERMLIKSMFSAYVHPSVVDALIAHPETLVLGGERKDLTVLFSDIEGFTTISQDLAPEALVGLLNEYLSIMTEVILRNHGTLDKYIGDAVMGFWGAPVPRQDHALHACLAALQMQGAMTEVNARWAVEGKPGFRTRIGIHTGPMIVGNMGGSGKFSYTVVGDSVNLASRLEGANKEYGTGIMVSEATFALVRERIVGRELDRIAVKGRTEPVTVFEILRERSRPPEGKEKEFLELYERGLEAYYRRSWKESLAHFAAALRLQPRDVPASLHRDRAALYAKKPPPADWNGVHIMKSK
jgi:adenylate cyclase